MTAGQRFLGWMLVPVAVALAASAIAPYDRLTWWLEVLPVLLVVPVLVATAGRFPLSRLLYGLIALHALILIAGGTWTYARVPAGFWVQEAFDLARNPYDKLGHFAQGLVPALAARELLLRHGWVSGQAVAAWLSVCVAMTISALYELVEWAAALAIGQGADEFLGTQGDEWDTQSDMFLALLGALATVLLLGRWHDRALRRLGAAVESR